MGGFRVIEKESRAYFEGLSFAPHKLKGLNVEQTQALEQITKSVEDQTFSNFLLHGITGSGKTEVYIHTLKLCLENNAAVLSLSQKLRLHRKQLQDFIRFLEIILPFCTAECRLVNG